MCHQWDCELNVGLRISEWFEFLPLECSEENTLRRNKLAFTWADDKDYYFGRLIKSAITLLLRQTGMARQFNTLLAEN